MASYDILTLVGAKQKRLPSASSEVDFSSVRIGADSLTLSQTGSGGSAAFDFGAKKLKNLADPLDSELAAAATVNFVLQQVAATGTSAEWQDSVLDKDTTTPPGSPTTGDRYLIGLDTGASAATGDWAGKDGQIAEYNGATWDFAVPTVGTFVSADDESSGIYYFGGTIWVFKSFEATTASGGLVKTGFDIAVQLEASNPSLQVSGGELGVKFDPAGALSKGASGTKANVDADTLKIASNNLAVDHAKSFTNDNAGSITVGQVAYVKSNGNVDLAQANVAALPDSELGLVEDATIATTASGKVTVRRGAIVGGYSGLTPGKLQYVSRDTAGAIVETLTGFVAGEFVYSVGRAISATEILFNPKFEFEF